MDLRMRAVICSTHRAATYRHVKHTSTRHIHSCSILGLSIDGRWRGLLSCIPLNFKQQDAREISRKLAYLSQALATREKEAQCRRTDTPCLLKDFVVSVEKRVTRSQIGAFSEQARICEQRRLSAILT